MKLGNVIIEMKSYVIRFVKSNKALFKLYQKADEVFFSLITIISPKWNTQLRYRQAFGKKLNLVNPKTFQEKLLKLKLSDYNNNPLVTLCADKLRVREYVEKCGCSDILNELIGVYECAKEIPWDNLPNRFVMKWNFGAGMNIICRSKEDIDRKDAIKKLDKWQQSKYWLPYSEMQYKYILKRIVCEKYLSMKKDGEMHEEVIPDYKVYCFHGEPQAIFVMHGRYGDLKTEFFDTQWKPLGNSPKYGNVDKKTPKPSCLDKMLDYSRKLSAPFPFVRCDYYIVNDRLFFGELTFTPAGGLYTSETLIHGKSMGDFLHI